MDTDSEDNYAKDARATTLCGLPAAMDSAPAPKAISPMKLWSSSNKKWTGNKNIKTNKSYPDGS